MYPEHLVVSMYDVIIETPVCRLHILNIFIYLIFITVYRYEVEYHLPGVSGPRLGGTYVHHHGFSSGGLRHCLDKIFHMW